MTEIDLVMDGFKIQTQILYFEDGKQAWNNPIQ